MDIKLYATVLLVARLITMGFVVAVIVRQLSLFKLPFEREEEMTFKQRRNLKIYRVVLFALAGSFLIINLIPAGIDVLTIFAELDRSTRVVKPISILYTLTWAGGSIIMAVLLWLLYYLSRLVNSRPNADGDRIEHNTLINNKTQEK